MGQLQSSVSLLILNAPLPLYYVFTAQNKHLLNVCPKLLIIISSGVCVVNCFNTSYSIFVNLQSKVWLMAYHTDISLAKVCKCNVNGVNLIYAESEKGAHMKNKIQHLTLQEHRASRRQYQRDW